MSLKYPVFFHYNISTEGPLFSGLFFHKEFEEMITGVTNPRMKQVVAWQQKARERRRDKVFLAEGVKMFLEAPPDWIMEVYLTEALFEKQKANQAFKDRLKAVGYELVSEEVFSRISDTQTPQGILCVLRQPEYELSDLLKGENPLLIVLENLQDPGNLGTILRTGEGAGISGVIMSNGTVDIFNPKVIRSTMGSVYRVPFLYTSDLQEILHKLQNAGVRTFAAHLKGKQYFQETGFRGPCAFLIGNEGNGLTDEISQCAGEYIKIPMEGKVESLNASVAASLLMYEAYRQRHLS